MDLVKKYTKILKEKFQEPEFQNDIDNIFIYYYKKCTMNLENNERNSWIFDDLDRMFNLMFLQGYLVMNETMKENEDLLETPKEPITYEEVIQEMPNIIRTLFKEHPEVLNVKICNEFAIDVLTAMDQDLYEVITNSFNEIAYYGGCYAYIHKYEENIIREHKNELTSFEGLHFLTPQVYMYQKPNDESLTYELYGWAGSILNNQWLGRVQFNPFKKDGDSLLAEIMLSDLIAAAEKNEIISLIMNILKNTTKVADNEKTIFINHFNVSTTNTYVIENVAVQAK